jgi:phosphoglycerate dehydrogenase-like enzyme
MDGVELVVLDAADQRRDALADADAVICMRLAPADVERAERLRLVQAMATGVDSIAVDALPAGCVVCNVHAHETAIGEYVLMAMLALARRLVPQDRALRGGTWIGPNTEAPRDRDLRGRTVGVVGLGHIGERVVELGRGIGMRAIGITHRPSEERARAAGVEWLGAMDELPRLLREADFAVVAVPLAPETRGLIGARELDLLGPEGYLVNVARGPIVDEAALYEALRDGRIAGAAIDVWWNYPPRRGEEVVPAAYPFWELDNVVLSPHSSGQSLSMIDGRWDFAFAQLGRLAAGAPLEKVLRAG